MKTLPNVVGGTTVTPDTAQTLTIIDPSTEEPFAQVPVAGTEDVDHAFTVAAEAFEETWRWTTPSERQRALLKIADALESRAEEFADVESRDTGKPRKDLVAD